MQLDNINADLSERHRPKDFSEVIGQELAIDSLEMMLGRSEGPPRAFLFHGPTGCGKTTLAYIIKNKMKCHDRDYFYYNTSNVRGIDSIRDIDVKCKYKPQGGPVKVYILDESHKLTNDAQNALLQLLEKPPAHAYFFLCTTNPEKLIETLRGRCSSIKLNLIAPYKLKALMEEILEKEKITNFPSAALTKISKSANGSARNALKVLDRVIHLKDENVIIRIASEGFVENAQVLDICRLLMEPPSPNKWERLALLIKGVDVEPEMIRMSILGYLTAVLLNSPQRNDRVAKMMNIFLDSVMYQGKGGIIHKIYLAEIL